MEPQRKGSGSIRDLAAARTAARPAVGNGITAATRSVPTNVMRFERRNSRKAVEIAVAMYDRQSMAQRTGCDEAVDARAHRDPRLSTPAVQVDRLVKNRALQRRLHDRQRVQGFSRDLKRPLIAKPLEDFLNHGQTRDNLFKIGGRFQLKGRAAPEHFDPD